MFFAGPAFCPHVPTASPGIFTCIQHTSCALSTSEIHDVECQRLQKYVMLNVHDYIYSLLFASVVDRHASFCLNWLLHTKKLPHKKPTAFVVNQVHTPFTTFLVQSKKTYSIRLSILLHWNHILTPFTYFLLHSSRIRTPF